MDEADEVRKSRRILPESYFFASLYASIAKAALIKRYARVLRVIYRGPSSTITDSGAKRIEAMLRINPIESKVPTPALFLL